MTRQQAEQKLKSTFGFNEFHDNQWTVIDKILQGQRVLLIEKTGFGKSLCYQFPATQFEGVTIIFSPLIALMRDQVQKMQDLGIAANFISSQHTEEENNQTINDALNGKLKLLYIHPARMENVKWLETVRDKNFKIAMVVVDEAHCISTWGHDFIPSYRKIVNLVNLLPLNFPVLATTATATKRVEEDIKAQIGKNIISIRGNLLRENLKLYVITVQSEDEKMIWLAQNLEKIQGTGVVYTGTRVSTEIYAKWFEYLKIKSVHYNSGIDTETKKDIEQGLMSNEYKCVVSTNALGMGIDKSDIRFVVHTQIPVSPIHYYQEIGRAGRDGKPSHIILFYNPNDDKTLPLSFIEGGRPEIKKYQRVIDAVKSERLGLHGIIKATNLKQTQVNVILADLIAQGIVIEAIDRNSKKYEFKFGSPALDTKSFEELRDAKLKEFDEMLNYLTISTCRMKFLCDFLGDNLHKDCGVCDNCRQKNIQVSVTEDWRNKLADFRETYFPILEVENKTTNLVNGVAASYYGISNVGQALHRSKYENGGDFPDWLLRLTLKAFYRHFGKEKFDVVLYVPPTESGDLVKNFAEKIAKSLNFTFSNALKKSRTTQSQKIFQTGLLKKDNLKDAFILENPNQIIGKTVLLIDDIYDSGATIKEIGKYLSKLGAVKVAPLVIAKTVGGDL
ncbi:RecQ family ATP-dependent DNA helicase [Thermoflexibacter ruber]|uniref:ATP-dependent DNA helicase RecQ n=1 Tax=Thermoflexibacter ruber TaxID=1003 RepID=A0A1I2K7E3_9BACT|nr:RecQ family ATP-dependent DNA helicase [Thermoflexibacter ruber]SFF62110.1 ATP-dependent DNA helicase, RecQ-like [Thermoflexibacter ruber]